MLAGLGCMAGCGGGSDTPSEPLPTSTEQGTTARPLDVAIAGGGAFILTDGTGTQRVYSRLGHFDLDAQGRLIDAQGLRVAGSAPGTETAPLPVRAQDVQALPAFAWTMAPARTRRLVVSANLDSSHANLDLPPMDVNDGDSYSFATSLSVYDASGSVIALVLYFRHQAQDTWQVFVTANGTLLSVPPMVLAFNAPGTLKQQPPAIWTVDLPAAIRPDGSRQPSLAGVELDMRLVTQFASLFAIEDLPQDGYPAGRLEAVRIDSDGQILLAYDNGQQVRGGRILLARLTVADRLQRTGASAWRCGEGCQEPAAGIPGTNLLGTLATGALNLVY